MPQRGPGDGATSSGGGGRLRPEHLKAGDQVEVWSDSAQTWLPGLVEEVYAADCRSADGYAVRAGSVKVVSHTGVKYVQPGQVPTALRRLGGVSDDGQRRKSGRGGGGSVAASGSGAASRLKPTARGRVGNPRLKARDRWNASEIKIQELFAAYDHDCSGVLEQDEFRELLRDFNNGRALSEQEFNFMLRLSDTNHDGSISLSEMHFALRAWHSYRHLDDAVLSLFSEFDTDESGRLDLHEIKELLTALNDGVPVPLQEVQWVMDRGDVLGDGAVNRSELLGAVAAWYAHVDREASDVPTLMREAVARTAAETSNARVLSEGRKSLTHATSLLRGGSPGGYLEVGSSAASAAASAATSAANGSSGSGSPPPAASSSRAATAAASAAGAQDASADGRTPASFGAKVAWFLVRALSKFCYITFPFLFGALLAAVGWETRDRTCPRNLDGILLWFGLLAVLLAALGYNRRDDWAARSRVALAVILSLLDLVGVLWSYDDMVQNHKSECGHGLVFGSMLLWPSIPVVVLAYGVYSFASHVRLLQGHDQKLQQEVMV